MAERRADDDEVGGGGGLHCASATSWCRLAEAQSMVMCALLRAVCRWAGALINLACMRAQVFAPSDQVGGDAKGWWSVCPGGGEPQSAPTFTLALR